MNIKNNLKELRTKKDITQIKLSTDLGVTQETVSAYETCKILPNPRMLITLADYYNTSIDYILCRTKYDMRIDDVKPNNVSESDFNHLNQYRSLSHENQKLVDAYTQALYDKKS